MEVYIRDSKTSLPEWNGQSFLLVDPMQEHAMLQDGVRYDDWTATARDVQIGRYLPIGYGAELPPDVVGSSDWIKIKTDDITIIDSESRIAATNAPDGDGGAR